MGFVYFLFFLLSFRLCFLFSLLCLRSSFTNHQLDLFSGLQLDIPNHIIAEAMLSLVEVYAFSLLSTLIINQEEPMIAKWFIIAEWQVAPILNKVNA